ncbi:hypothetical protein OL229_00830 [Neisseriaceae bacterium JH1-16]|nr:hypothetical protein [Neisseriaceae bacterium JH1-16]
MRKPFSCMLHSWAQHACRLALVTAALAFAVAATGTHALGNPTSVMDGTYLYAAVPGVGNHFEKGGDGIVVFDVDHGFKFVKRISLPTLRNRPPELAKGIVSHLRKAAVSVFR